MTNTLLRLEALDGYPLAAHHFFPEAGESRAVLVMAGATGVPQRVYWRFAEALTQHGFEVLTMDFRGVGESQPKSLKGFDCGYLHWARVDLPALMTAAHARGPTLVIGHSFGGHAFGQLPEPNRALGLFTVATGAAWSGYMPPLERLKVETMWNVFGPVVTRVTGYLPGPVWGGVALPLGVYRDWKRWSHLPGYFFDDPRVDMQPLFDRVTVPVTGVTASDDKWAPPTSMQVFLSHYRNAPLTLRTHRPDELGVEALGHVGHFKQRALPRFVPEVVAWANQRLSA